MEAATELKAILVHKWQERQKLLQESATDLKAALTDAVQGTGLTQFTNDSRVDYVISALMTKNEEIKKILESIDAPEGGDYIEETREGLDRLLRSTGKLLDKKKVRGKVQYLMETEVSKTSLSKTWEPETDVIQYVHQNTVLKFDGKYRMEHVRHGAFAGHTARAFAGHTASARTRRAEGRKQVKKDGKSWQKIRKDLKETQELMCGYCKEPLPLAFHVDHVNEDPGNNNPNNLVACCPTCHDRKGRAYSNRKDYILRPMIYRLNINRDGWGQDLVPAVWLENYSNELNFPQYAQYLPAPASRRDKGYDNALEKLKVKPIGVDITPVMPRVRQNNTLGLGLSTPVGNYTVVNKTQMTPVPRVWQKKNMLVGKKVTVQFNDGQFYPGTVTARIKTSHIATARQYKVQYKDKDVWTHNVEDLLMRVNTRIKVEVGDLVMKAVPPQTFTGIVTSIADKYTILWDDGKTQKREPDEARRMRLRFLLLLQEEQDAMWEVFVDRTDDEAVNLAKAFTTPT